MSMIADGIASVVANAVRANSNKYAPLETVTGVELPRYTGKWYEIATIPQFYEKGTHCTTAEYALEKDGSVTVLNTTHKIEAPGEVKIIRGKAFPDKKESGKLEVQFWWPFRGLYWIIELDKDYYSYSVVGHPNRQYLWILCRSPKMNAHIYEQLVERLKQKGFPVERLKMTDQSCNL